MLDSCVQEPSATVKDSAGAPSVTAMSRLSAAHSKDGCAMAAVGAPSAVGTLRLVGATVKDCARVGAPRLVATLRLVGVTVRLCARVGAPRLVATLRLVGAIVWARL